MKLVKRLKLWVRESLKELIKLELEPELKDLERSWERVNQQAEEVKKVAATADAMSVVTGLMREVGDVKHSNLSLSVELDWQKKTLISLTQEVERLIELTGKLQDEHRELQVQLDALRTTNKKWKLK